MPFGKRGSGLRTESMRGPESLSSLNDQIDALNKQLAAIPSQLAELTALKQSDDINDADFNLKTSWLTQRQHDIPREIMSIRKRIDSVSSALARSALK